VTAKIPASGTCRRALYDLLHDRPDEWIEFAGADYGSPSGVYSTLISLRNDFGMDVRAISTGKHGRYRWRYVPAREARYG
jgi:hypothetical protein